MSEVTGGKITRENLEQYLGHEMIEVKVRNSVGRTPECWWVIRRNGKTKLYRLYPNRFRIPVKAGLRWYSEITDKDLVVDGTLDPVRFRLKAGI